MLSRCDLWWTKLHWAVPPTSTSVFPVSIILPALSTDLHLSNVVTIRTSG